MVIAGDSNGHVGNNIEDFEDQHRGHSYGDKNKKVERILKFCAAINIIVGCF